MTYAEIMIARRGYYDRLHDSQRVAAWAVAHTLQVWSKEPITPGMLLGEEAPARQYTDEASYRAAMRARQAQADHEDI